MSIGTSTNCRTTQAHDTASTASTMWQPWTTYIDSYGLSSHRWLPPLMYSFISSTSIFSSTSGASVERSIAAAGLASRAVTPRPALQRATDPTQPVAAHTLAGPIALLSIDRVFIGLPAG